MNIHPPATITTARIALCERLRHFHNACKWPDTLQIGGEPPGRSDLLGLAWHGSKAKSTPMLQSKSNASYLNRNNSYLYRLVLDPGLEPKPADGMS
jgi:hypothetical protein